MKTQTDIRVLDKLVIVGLQVKIWSARRKLLPHDLDITHLPPEDLASLGSKRICDPEDLKHFGTLKARAVSVLEKNGIRFLNGFALPQERMDEVIAELTSIKDDFDTAKASFLARYEKSVKDWIAKHPSWGEIITSAIVSEDYVRSRLDFAWQMFRVAAPAADDPQAMTDNLTQGVAGLGGTLFDEIAKDATDTWHRCYAGKAEVTRKALSPLKTMYDKLMGLTFIEPRVAPVVELLDTALYSIPKRGPIAGTTLLMLQGLVSILRTPHELLTHAQMILDGRKNSHSILESFSTKVIKPPKSTPSSPRLCLESHGLW